MNCCQASGTSGDSPRLSRPPMSLGIEVNIKPVSCVGACNQVPLIDVAHPDGSIERYPNVRPEGDQRNLMTSISTGKPFEAFKRIRS